MFHKQITYTKIFRVLVMGFSAVIVLLVAAGFIGAKNAQLIQESAAALTQNQLLANRLIEELQREQQTLNAVFYKLSKGPEQVDRARLLSQLDEAGQSVDRLTKETAGFANEKLLRQLHAATFAFSSEARRLLAESKVPSYSSRELFRRHEEVVTITAGLIGVGFERATNAQSQIARRSRQLVNQTFLLLSGGLLLALLCAILTVRIAADLFHKMEWQSSELTRVTWHLLDNQETIARRFSHELHDELGQCLTALRANLAALGTESLRDRSRLDDCTQLVDEAVQNVRELSQLLRPTILDDFGLDAGLRWQAERFSQRTGIEVSYNSDFRDRLPDETETHIFRLVQEALTNAARHSGATRVMIDLHPEAGRLHLTLKDNGRGLPSGDGFNSRGMGLIGMRARARTAGGELEIHSREGDGVRIELWVPLQLQER